MENNDKKWYAVYTNPRAEKKVFDRLINAGIEAYCPLRRVLKQWSDRRKKIDEPLFRSYVFVKINLQEYEKVRRVNGVVNFVYYLGKPAIIRDYEIENIKIFLSKTSGCEIKFEANQRVRIKEGVLKDTEGKIVQQSKHNLRIEIEQLGLALVAEIKKDFVEPLKGSQDN